MNESNEGRPEDQEQVLAEARRKAERGVRLCNLLLGEVGKGGPDETPEQALVRVLKERDQKHREVAELELRIKEGREQNRRLQERANVGDRLVNALIAVAGDNGKTESVDECLQRIIRERAEFKERAESSEKAIADRPAFALGSLDGVAGATARLRQIIDPDDKYHWNMDGCMGEVQRLRMAEHRLLAEVRAGRDGTCLLAGPGRGDCEHAVGLPGAHVPGQHDGADTTVDARGKPNGWCWFCWLRHERDAAKAGAGSATPKKAKVGGPAFRLDLGEGQIATLNLPSSHTEAEGRALSAVAAAYEALNVACSKLAQALVPVAVVEAERGGRTPHPLEVILHAREQAVVAAAALGVLTRSELQAGLEAFITAPALGRSTLA